MDVYPDLIIYKEKIGEIVEVKFVSLESLINLRISEAEKELNRQIDKLKKYSILRDLNIRYKTIAIVYYNFKVAENKGILIIKRDKISECKYEKEK